MAGILLALATALAVGHVGSAAAVVPQVLLLLPAALVLVYEIGRRLGSGVHAAWTSLVWEWGGETVDATYSKAAL